MSLPSIAHLRGSFGSRSTTRTRGGGSAFASVLALLFCGGCATYRPLALPASPDLTRTPALIVPAGRLELPGVPPRRIDVTRPLDETAVATLAVLNDPELKAVRQQAHVAEAQLLEAGLLPDPQFAAGLNRSAVRKGYTVGVAEDLQALVTLPAVKAAARAHEHEVNLQILWQEWQVAERARELVVQICSDRALQRGLATAHRLLGRRCQADHAAFRRDEITAATLAADLSALSGAETRRRRLSLDLNRARHALNQLLGLQPDVTLRLAGIVPAPELSPSDFREAVGALPHRRADLLALEAGYRSQEQRVRAAVLAQFPSLSAGVEQARSAEEGIHTTGFTVNLTLPLFNRNRGQIAVQRATRARLRQVYQARLDAAVGQADELWQAIRLMAPQQRDLAVRLAEVRTAIDAAKQDLQRGEATLGTLVRLQSEALAVEDEAIRLQAARARAAIALQTVLGLPILGPSGP